MVLKLDIEYVVGYLFNDDGTEVALIRKTHPPEQAGLYNGIGGKLQSCFEENARAMVREFKEETGLATPIDLWQGTVYLQGVDWRVFYFRAFSSETLELLRAKTEWPTDEHVHIWPVAALPENLYSHVAWTVHMSVAPHIQFPLRVDDKTPLPAYICPMCLKQYVHEDHSECPHCGYGHNKGAD